MNESFYVLLLEDAEADAEATRSTLLEAAPFCTIATVRTREEFDEALQRSEPDVILSAYLLTTWHGLLALEMTRNTGPRCRSCWSAGCWASKQR